LEDVSKVITFAKLNEADLLPLSQVISFSPDLLGGDVRLIEVPPSLADQLTTGSLLTFRGREDDSVVLCAQDKTYDIKEAETSNSLFLVPQLDVLDSIQNEGERTLAYKTVDGIFHTYLEVLESQPRLKRLNTLLEKNPYREKSPNSESQIGYTVSQLLEEVQASEQELIDALQQCEAVRVDGEWFLLDRDYQMKVLSYILRYFDEESWKFDCVQKAPTVTALEELVPKEISRQVFDMYCSPLEGGEIGEYSLDKDKVCRFYGDFLLAANVKFKLSEFLDMWQKAVPEGITTELSQLKGLMLVDEKVEPPTIRRFTEASLPEGVNDRLNILFKARERWTLQDISPFVAPLTTPKLNVNALLTKYARPLNVQGTKYFCAKHGK